MRPSNWRLDIALGGKRQERRPKSNAGRTNPEEKNVKKEREKRKEGTANEGSEPQFYFFMVDNAILLDTARSSFSARKSLFSSRSFQSNFQSSPIILQHFRTL